MHARDAPSALEKLGRGLRGPMLRAAGISGVTGPVPARPQEGLSQGDDPRLKTFSLVLSASLCKCYQHKERLTELSGIQRRERLNTYFPVSSQGHGNSPKPAHLQARRCRVPSLIPCPTREKPTGLSLPEQSPRPEGCWRALFLSSFGTCF